MSDGSCSTWNILRLRNYKSKAQGTGRRIRKNLKSEISDLKCSVESDVNFHVCKDEPGTGRKGRQNISNLKSEISNLLLRPAPCALRLKYRIINDAESYLL